MYLFQNAVRNIFRNKGRNIILALITFLIIFAVTVSFLISGSTKSIISNARAQFGSQVFIVSAGAKEPELSDYLKYGESDLLQKMELSMRSYGRLDGLRALDEEIPDENANVILVSTSRTDLSEEFRKGLRSIAQGLSLIHIWGLTAHISFFAVMHKNRPWLQIETVACFLLQREPSSLCNKTLRGDRTAR